MPQNCWALMMIVLVANAGCGQGDEVSPDSDGTSVKALERVPWGEVEGEEVFLYTLRNSRGMLAKITNYGTILTELHVPDRNGETVDVVLGFSRLEDYLSGHPYFGCTVGRVANRIGGGKFRLDGKEYTLATNNGPNHLHGGEIGFDKKVWQVTAERDSAESVSLTLEYTSPNGEEGYPGTLTASVTYTLTADNQLKLEMVGRSDAPTIVNLANHSYWNLAGHDAGDSLGHQLLLRAESYTATDPFRVPTGEIASVEGTPLDFTLAKTMARDIAELPGLTDSDPGGYDHNYVLSGEPGQLRLAAKVVEPTSGLSMEVHTTAPGVQLYSGNFLDGSLKGKGGTVYEKHGGFCLETQHYPDSINKEGRPNWPSVILRPGEVYRHEVVFRFGTGS